MMEDLITWSPIKYSNYKLNQLSLSFLRNKKKQVFKVHSSAFLLMKLHCSETCCRYPSSRDNRCFRISKDFPGTINNNNLVLQEQYRHMHTEEEN